MSGRRDFLKHLGFHLNPPPMSNTTLPEELIQEIFASSEKYTRDIGYQNAYIAGATEYATYKVRCEQALQYIGDMHSSGCIELNNYHINEIQKLLDEGNR